MTSDISQGPSRVVKLLLVDKLQLPWPQSQVPGRLWDEQ